ncbi:OmpA family protein [Salibacterium aidingense]|uniref:OmpA family protein n=1 Tax=Salibacterium aidingense TaxID=384933 RepID=UPI0009FBCAC9|nr:OmpA family protein [Salibacterium aidingense]
MPYADLMSAMLMIFALLLTFIILDYRQVLETKEQEIEEIVDVKTNIITELMEAFEESGMEIEIDEQTGAIRFPGNILFETDSANISNEGEEFLREFIPKYLSVLLQEKFRDDISTVIIEGHTDRKGSYLYNMNLSQERAFGVVDFIYSDDEIEFKEKEMSKEYVTGNGRSFSVPLNDDEGEYDAERSRRVEFLFRLKDEDQIEQIGELIDDEI